MAQERIQKILAKAGLGSRRACEVLIKEGRVAVNGRIARLGEKADPLKDEIHFDGERIKRSEKLVYIAMNKPAGVLSSLKSQGGHPTVIDLIDIPERVYPIGRLDLDSQGLLLLTNDGTLTNRLSHPSFGHEKEYRVLLDRFPEEAQLAAWCRGVILPDGQKSLPAVVKMEAGRKDEPWVRVILRQGRKRQIRETAKILHLQVRKLIRLRIGPIRLGNLKSGEWRTLTREEERKLKFDVLQSSAGSFTRKRSKSSS
jgi:23S rRNA pseudouridine2605 synthase